MKTDLDSRGIRPVFDSLLLQVELYRYVSWIDGQSFLHLFFSPSLLSGLFSFFFFVVLLLLLLLWVEMRVFYCYGMVRKFSFGFTFSFPFFFFFSSIMLDLLYKRIA